MLRYFTAGESHGEALVAFLSGMPAGLKVDQGFVDRELWRRQQGYGRGGRMKIERDTAHVLSGVRHGFTIGSPISIQLYLSRATQMIGPRRPNASWRPLACALNAVVWLETTLEPRELLWQLLLIEKRMGRVRSQRGDGRPRVGGYFAPFAAFVVREKGQPPVVEGL